MDSRTDQAIALMEAFAGRTGLDGVRASRRYLWTDAFAVCNFLGLARATGDDRLAGLALRLVDAVHHVLGRHRPDDRRRGWISGLDEASGEAHPTAGGLRIGKPLPERGPDEPFVERTEWDRDGQYFHYLTKWMHALDQVSRATGDATANARASELARVAHRAFTYAASAGTRRRMYWKMSIDLSRPQVASMGQHDPLDGFVTCVQLDAAPGSTARLSDARADFASMLDAASLATSDPLGIGGLLGDAFRLQQLSRQGAISGADPLLAALLAAGAQGLRAYVDKPDLRAPPAHRLAFRELGLAIGLAAIEHLASEAGTLATEVRSALERCLRFVALRGAIESLWIRPESRATETWVAHADINDVMLATSLHHEGFSILRAPEVSPSR